MHRLSDTREKTVADSRGRSPTGGGMRVLLPCRSGATRRRAARHPRPVAVPSGCWLKNAYSDCSP